MLCKQRYYEGSPIISDVEYDKLVDIYGEPQVGFRDGDLPHLETMYSLQKFYVGEDFPDFGDSVKTFKYDGAAVGLIYYESKLVAGITRGDGVFGKDITANIKHLVPNWVDDFRTETQVFGEVLAPKTIPNARNYAAGALQLKDEEEFKSRELYFKAYGVAPRAYNSYRQDLEWLKKAGFDTVLKDNDRFPTDGWVVRLNDNAAYNSAGFTSKHPKGAYAIKTRFEGIPTKVLDVVWQTGRTGKVTPVAILEPVIIDGAVISRATLNNYEFLEVLGVEVGSTVLIERAGGIIPRIISVVDDQ